MAYICTLNIKCNSCPHYRMDEDYDSYACFAEQDEKKHNNEKERLCKRCGSKVVKETIVHQYPYYCPSCDENMFSFETEIKGEN